MLSLPYTDFNILYCTHGLEEAEVQSLGSGLDSKNYGVAAAPGMVTFQRECVQQPRKVSHGQRTMRQETVTTYFRDLVQLGSDEMGLDILASLITYISYYPL